MTKAEYEAFCALLGDGIKKGTIQRTTISHLSEWNLKENDKGKLQD